MNFGEDGFMRFMHVYAVFRGAHGRHELRPHGPSLAVHIFLCKSVVLLRRVTLIRQSLTCTWWGRNIPPTKKLHKFLPQDSVPSCLVFLLFSGIQVVGLLVCMLRVVFG